MARRKAGKNKDYLSQAQGRIELTRQWRRNKDIDDSWKRFIDLYHHKQYSEDTASAEDRVVVNYIFSTINVMFPSVTVNQPKILVSARREEEAQAADVVEAVINYWWKHLQFQKQFRRAAKDYLIIGHGWLKTCWKYEEETVARSESDVAAEYQDLMGQQQDFANQDPSMAQDMPSSQDVMSQIPLHELQVNADQPHVERVSPFDMYIDPVASALEEARWIAQRIWMTVEEVQNDSRFDEKVRSKAKGTGQGPWGTDDQEDLDDDKRYDKSADYVCVWEYYDIANDVMCTFTEGCGKGEYLVKPRKIPYPFGHPYVMLVNYEVPEHIYPLGDVEALESLQLELNLTRTQMINDRKQNVQKYVAWVEDIDKTVEAALASSNHNEIIKFKRDSGTDLRDKLIPLTPAPVAPDFYNQSELIQGDLNLVSGVSEYQRGSTPNTRQTATEASIIADSSNARSADKLAAIEGAIGEVANRLITLAQMYLTTEQTARIVGSDGAQMWVQFDAEAIAGEFDFEAEGGSTQPNNESMRRQSATQLAQVMAPFIANGVIDPHEMARYLLKQFSISNPARFLQAPPPPMPPGMPPPGAMPPGGGMPPGQEAPGGPPGAPPAPIVPPPGVPMAPPQGGPVPPQGAPLPPPGMPSPSGEAQGLVDPRVLSQLPPEVIMALLQQLQGGGAPMPPGGVPVGGA